MASTLSPIRSKFSANRWPDDPSDDTIFRSAEPKDHSRFLRKGPSLGKRASRVFARFLITFSIGVGATLAWQSYGDAAREMIAYSSPQLAWLAPREPVARAAPDVVAAAAPAAPALDPKQIEAMSLSLAAVRQRMDQLAAQLAFNQQQMVGEIAKLQSTEREILHNVSAPPPQPAAALARKPVLPKPQPLTQAPPAR